VAYRLYIEEGVRHEEYYAILAMPTDWEMWRSWPQNPMGGYTVNAKASPMWKKIVRAFADAFEYANSGAARNEDLALNALERALLLATGMSRGEVRSQTDARVIEVMAYARERLERKLTVEELARVAHLSPSRLAHLFTQELGESPMWHVEGVRVRRAQELLLSTRLAVREVARMVGYENPYHFSDRFRSRTGQSPRAFRKSPPV
jgi:AraC family transcriptional regulator of arabinose operon